MSFRSWFSLLIAGTVVFGLSVPRAQAISAFARQYGTECSTCHDSIPHRNEFGEAFRRNGYVWPGEAPVKASETVEAFGISGIPTYIPLSVSGRLSAAYDGGLKDDKLSSDVDFQLHAGGSVKDVIGFFAHDLTGSGEAFGVFRRVGGSPVNLRFGNLVPQTTLWKPDQTYTLNPLALHTFTVAGEPALGTPRQALEADAVLGSRFFAVLGVADRSHQDRMEYYGHLAYKISGDDFEGIAPEMDLDEEESVWDFLTVTLGGYGYLGHTKSLDDDYYRIGFDAEAQYKGMTLLASYSFGNDDNADGFTLAVDSAVWLVEADVLCGNGYGLSARYEHEDVGNDPTGINRRVIAGVRYNPLQNVVLVLEGKYGWNYDPEDDTETTVNFLAQFHL